MFSTNMDRLGILAQSTIVNRLIKSRAQLFKNFNLHQNYLDLKIPCLLSRIRQSILLLCRFFKTK